jgi:hypothetical protein
MARGTTHELLRLMLCHLLTLKVGPHDATLIPSPLHCQSVLPRQTFPANPLLSYSLHNTGLLTTFEVACACVFQGGSESSAMCARFLYLFGFRF